jgi:hypothetical protein
MLEQIKNMRQQLLVLWILVGVIHCVAPVLEAANGTVLSRYWHTGSPYGAMSEPGCPDCSMAWQPIRSVMHPNVLPEGMWRPLPLRRSTPVVAPPTPSMHRVGLRAHWHLPFWDHGLWIPQALGANPIAP